MFRASLKSLWAYRARMTLTLMAIVLGVGLICGVYVYSDTINRGFNEIFEESFSGVDIVVRTESDFTFGEGSFMDQEDFDRLASVPGVQRAYPSLAGQGLSLLDREGEVIGAQGTPTFTSNLEEGDSAGFVIDQGLFPAGPDQVALDRATADANGFQIGERISLVSKQLGRMEPVLTATARLAEIDNLGSRWVLFDLPTAQQALGLPGKVSGGNVYVIPGTPVEEVIAAMTPLLPPNAAVVSGQQAAEEQAAELQGSLGFLTTFLTVFGYIALFVGAFLIYNTFRIVVSQRTRDLALLRAIGAAKSQVMAIVLLESLFLGVLGSLLGIAFGLLIALLLQTGLGAIGLTFPTTSLVIAARTIIVGLAAGTLVTVGSSLAPARRASRVPIMAALNEDAAAPARRGLVKRAAGGGAVAAAGVGAAWLGLFGGGGLGLSAVVWVGIGVGIVFFGMFILSPLFAAPITNLLGWVAQRTGVAGKLARRNAMRSPRRTAATAGAVMISITLVALASTMSGSLRATIDEVLADDVEADVFITSSNQFDPTAGFTTQLAEQVRGLEQVGDLTRLQVAPVRTLSVRETAAGTEENVSELNITSVEPNFARFVPPESSAGTLHPGAGEVVMEESIAAGNGWTIGGEVTLQFEQAGERTFTLAGTAAGPAWTGLILIDRSEWPGLFNSVSDSQIYIQAAPGVSPDDLKAAIEAQPLVEELATINVQTEEDLLSQAEQGINQLLNLILALLGITVIIGMLGVTNTMALSVFERTREIGLLRAVGLDRPTARWMVRMEAVIVSVFGCLLGVGLGILFGWAIVRSLNDIGITSFLIPWLPDSWTVSSVLGSLLFWVAATAVLGVAFASYPARRAAKLNVVEAIARF